MSKKFDQFSRPDYSFNSRRARKVEIGSQKRFAAQQENSFDRLNLALNEPGLIALPEVQRQLRQAESRLKPKENILVQSMLADGITTRAAFEQRVARTGFGLSEAGKSRIWLVMLLSILLVVTLAACGATGTGTPTEIFTPIATSLPAEAEETSTTQVEATSTALDEIDINYGRFTGSEAQVDPYIEKAWVLIDKYLVEKGIVAPNGIEVVDVSSENVIVEVISGSGYTEGTMFTISFVAGHSGEILTVSLDGANAVAGGSAVELAIGANQLPVALDVQGKVVAYVDATTGQWVAGTTALAGEIVATPEPPAPNYFDLSPAERTKQSQALVEQANNFSGEVGIPIELNGKKYNFFWSPTAVDKYENDFVGGWKLEGSAFELDRTGETLPQMVIPGYENEDGSLVVVDPVTGQETVYANQNIPALGGVISYRDLFNLPQSQLAKIVTEAALSDPDFGDNPGVVDNITALQSQSLYLPVMLWGEQNSVYASGSTGLSGSGIDVPEAGFDANNNPTNNALMPIYSPETGDFMFFINIMAGTPRSQYNVFYSPDGKTDSVSVSIQSRDCFGVNGLDKFGIITQSRFPQVAHNLGGENVFIENGSGVGDINIVEQIMNASSEEEIMNILDAYRLLVAYPSIVYRPAR